NCDLYIDDTSGYFKKKNKNRNYELHNFLIESNIADSNLKYDTYIRDIQRKFKKKLDFFGKKKFLIESKNNTKKTAFNKIDLNDYSDKIFIEGHYESEKYFIDYKKEIIQFFKIKKEKIDINNRYKKDIDNSNSVSICIRQNRYSEGKHKDHNKSNKFTKDTIDYIYKSIEHIKKNVEKPKFFIWSNDLSNLSGYFNQDECIFIDNKQNKSVNDFYLFNFCKHFIVGPTSFHWWGAWLNENPNKICIRPLNLNPSNNIDFWPENWVSI
uniref:alpha-1,2-fucosyltransferase n=1 Tax=Pelagibacter ubique TaxID=198252 RepID=UPI00094D58C6